MIERGKSTGLCLVLSAILLTGYAPRSNGAPSRGLEIRSSGLIDTHIVQGSGIDIEKVPYMISIEKWLKHHCGGGIISENWVITAAHCIDESSGALWAKRIRAGSTTEVPFIGWGGSIHQIELAVAHSNFSRITIDYDVGVIKVSNKFVYGPRVAAIPLPQESEDAFIEYGQIATIAGWGRIKETGWFIHTWWLQYATVPLVPRQKCIELHKDLSEAEDISPRNLCAGGTGKGGPCFGDSGGPLVHKGKLIGLVSWGVKCNDDKLPAVFSNVLHEDLRSFVKNYTNI